MIARAARHLAPERVRGITDGAEPRLDEVVHLLWCARCADALQRYERADHLAQEIARVTGAMQIPSPALARAALPSVRLYPNPAASRTDSMRIASIVLGVLCVLLGGVWFLQGVNVLPGSFMTGQTRWAVYGAVLALVGVGLLLRGRRRRA